MASLASETVHSDDHQEFSLSQGQSLSGYPCTSSLGFFFLIRGVNKIVKIKQELIKWNPNSNSFVKNQYLVNALLSLFFFLLLFPILPSLPHFFPSVSFSLPFYGSLFMANYALAPCCW